MDVIFHWLIPGTIVTIGIVAVVTTPRKKKRNKIYLGTNKSDHRLYY